MTVSVVIPARGEESTLPHTLPRVLAAADAIGAEVVVVIPEGETFQRNLIVAARVRWILIDAPGKFAALRRGVQNARGDRVIFVDADVVPDPQAFAALDAAMSAGADVAAGRIVVAPPRAGDPALLRRWAQITAATWHDCRQTHRELRWALPGALYGLRREFFPAGEPVIPVLDDVSIGLWAGDHGATIDYVPAATVSVAAPSSHRGWIRQKLRTRAGWERLAQLRPSDAAALESALGWHRRMHVAGDPAGRLMCAQDRLLRLAVRHLRTDAWDRGEWLPDRTSSVASVEVADHAR
ncbi:glycosyltransferase [Nocardia gipuzkoensis]|uniref:glycosyltransferase n=1 Tax=Nocardia gipuzkoensis TaxID=2749991 RepID=UPI00237E2743|nr:glycosyltransferase family 2 protein [Nocardia gipuzkoensis]MDE1674754.1 glycosyltransferase family 2 protein [Nocardia gipuzkoensis]